MKHWYVDRVHEHATHRCGRCGHHLSWVAQVGWVDLTPGGTYDLCDADLYGNHLAEPGDSTAERRPVAR